MQHRYNQSWFALLLVPGEGLDPVAVVVAGQPSVQVKLGGQVPLELPPCQTAPLHCPSASRQLLYIVCRCPQTAPLHCLLVGVSLLLSILLAAARFVGEWGKRDAAGQRTGFNTLDNWGHKTPTQSKRIKNRKEKIKGSWPPEHVYNTLGYMYILSHV